MTTMSIGRETALTNSATEGTKCAVCAKNKFQLRNRKSRLSGRQMFVCNDCFNNKYEPRWLVILTAQSGEEPELVKQMILHHKYVGEEIPAADLYK